jgi:hypothetical protein
MKAKPVILVIITLLIGFIIGMLTSAQIRLHRMRPVRFYLSREEFREGFYKTIQADEKQKVQLEKILNNYDEINNNLLTDYRKGFEQNVKDMQKDLESILTKEQQDKLREIDERREEMFREARKNFGNDSLNRGRFDRRRDPNMGPPPQGRRPYTGNRPDRDDRQYQDGRPMPPRGGYLPANDSIAADSIRK